MIIRSHHFAQIRMEIDECIFLINTNCMNVSYKKWTFTDCLGQFLKKKDGDGRLKNRNDTESTEISVDLQLVLEDSDLVLTDYDVCKRMFHIRSYSSQMKRLPNNKISMEDNINLLHPEDRTEYTEVIEGLLNGRSKKTSDIFRFRGPDGTFHHYECRSIVKESGAKVCTITTVMKDISERLVGKRMMEESIQKMHYAIQATDTVFFELDMGTGMLKSYNEPLNNYDDSVQLSLDYYTALTHPNDRDKVKTVLAQLTASGEKQVTMDIRQKVALDSDWHYCTVTFVPFSFDKNGNVEKFVGFRRDNSLHIRYQKTLEEYKTKMELAIEGSEVMIWDYDLQSGIYTRKIGMNPKQGSLEEHCNRLAKYQPETIEPIYRLLKEGRNESFKVEVKEMNEQTGLMEYYTIMGIPFTVDENNKCLKYTGYRLNTTKWRDLNRNLENSNLLLNMVIDNLPCVLYIKDVDNGFRYTTTNKFMQELCHKSAAEMIGKNDTEIFGSKCGEKFLVSDRKTVAGNAYTYRETVCFNEKQYVLHNSKFIIHTISGKTLLIGIALDITFLDNILTELQLEKQKVQESDKLKSAFLANMSHEIRTPLNAIVGFSNLLQQTTDPEEQEEYIGIINQNNDLLLRLISDILDLSKIESGTIDFKKEQFDLSVLFEETYSSLKFRCVTPEVEFLERNPYNSCMVVLDKDRLVQIYTNFVTNAIKYTNRGHILMGYEYIDGGVRIYVEDTGTGIAKDKQQRVFERFEKLDQFVQGTGLGLAICKAIVEANDGEIGVDSEDGKGTTFWAWFPCHAEICENEKIIKENNPMKIVELVSTSELPRSILVAEDNDSNYLLVKAILKKCELTRACNGAEAVTLAAQNHYDAILMDIKMPVMDGLEATRRIREVDQGIPIIAITANAFDSDRVKALEAGCSAFISKPLKKTDLEEILRK